MIAHLALIMDGNRRWAKKRSLFPWQGHKEGVKTAEMAMRYCLEQDIAYLSLYVFSLENFKRSEKEISYLFSLLNETTGRIQDLIKQGIKIRFVGDWSFIPESVAKTCQDIQEKTKQGSKLTCNLLFCYGGQQEIVAAAEQIRQAGVSRVSVEEFKKYLWMGAIPDPDIIIRTGGVKRLSNFLLFQAAYAELRFLDCLWPDLTQEILDQTVQDAVVAHKNLGK